jgi:hypothetical protein
VLAVALAGPWRTKGVHPSLGEPRPLVTGGEKAQGQQPVGRSRAAP